MNSDYKAEPEETLLYDMLTAPSGLTVGQN